MTKRMLIDATHEEETRVAVVDGQRLFEFDYESKVRKQLKGSIFLAKVTRVEPSLQAAFVNFGGNRHGFLPFSEIHPDYFRIPIADRKKILEEQAEDMAAFEDDDEDEDEGAQESVETDDNDNDEDEDVIEEIGGENPSGLGETDDEPATAPLKGKGEQEEETSGNQNEAGPDKKEDQEKSAEGDETSDEETNGGDQQDNNRRGRGRGGRYRGRGGGRNRRMPHRSRKVEVVGGNDLEGEQPRRGNLRRQYKIQEVVKRGQIMLIQVSKEERGNKGAAVTTYLSLPGRYCVLMPNSPRGGGVSRKVPFAERKKLKDMLTDLKTPDGMSVILRTAGVSRTKPEIKRDLDYLMRLWDNIRELTLKSSAPALINEEGNLIKRSIRDLYTRDIDEVIVAGAEGYKNAKNFMKMLIPSHAKRVKEYREDELPLFHRYQVESQINEIGDPSVTLKSGGYLVINPTEALVSVDVNSGRATKERHIEETALKTNLEAADEVARQLRLRDLGGLVVIDFIDMEDRRNNAKVERRLKEALSTDRARIQIGRISSFGLMELSRQRMNPSLTEAQFQQCPHCAGVGYIRTADGAAISALRAAEEIATQRRHTELILHVPNSIAIYILNHKRDMLAAMEARYGFKLVVEADEQYAPDKFTVETGALKSEETTEQEEVQEQPAIVADEQEEESQEAKSRSGRRRGRRGGRRRGRGEDRESGGSDDSGEGQNQDKQGKDEAEAPEPAPVAEEREETPEEDKGRKKPPSKRGGRRKKAEPDNAAPPEPEGDHEDHQEEKAEQAEEANTEEVKAEKKKPRGRPRKKPAADEAPEADSSGDSSDDAQKEPSNDDQNAQKEETVVAAREPQASAEYEVISEAAGGKKRKGWWNRLIE